MKAVRWAIHAGGNVKLEGHHATAGCLSNL
jgi:hypothetical protein